MTFFGSSFLVLLLAINICLVYSVYPLAILGRMSVAPIGYMAIGAYATVYFTTRGGSFLIGFAVGVAISIAIAAVISLIAGHLRSHFFVASSLGATMIIQQAAFSLDKLTNGYLGVSAPEGIVHDGVVFALAALSVLGAISLKYSSLDRIWRAIGTDDRIAEALGISIRRHVLIAGVVSAVLATCAGAFYGHIIPFFDPNAFGMTQILLLAAATVVGGVVGWFGPLIGAVSMTTLPEILRDLGGWRDSVFGFILIVLVLLLPRGISDLRGLASLFTAAWLLLQRNTKTGPR